MNSENTCIGSTIFAVKPGDGSAREQAASCQKVLGGWANIANEYATKRYRSNLINWGMLPLPVYPERKTGSQRQSKRNESLCCRRWIKRNHPENG